MTNKKFRDDLAKEMRDKYNERNEKLEQAEKSSFSSGLKEQMKKEIMDNFTKEMDEMKSRPGYEDAKKTHLEEIKAKIGVNAAKKEKERLQKEYEEKLAKADEDIAESRKGYEDAQIPHRGKIEDDGNISENSEIPQFLLDYRQAWKDKIRCLSDNTKEKIAKVAENIPVKVETDSDGSRLIEFKLGNKTRKILDPKLKTHTDEKYFDSEEWEFITKRDERVQLGGMMGNDVSKWKNEKLKDYVQQKQKEGLHIPSQDEMKILLENLGNQADLDDIEDEIAMLMYLTGMDGYYWLSMRNGISRSGLECRRDVTYFYTSSRTIDDPASLCMIACE